MRKQTKPHQEGNQKKVVPLEEAFKIPLPKTEHEWLEVSKQKKRDFNDIAAEHGSPQGIIEELKKVSKICLHNNESPIVSAKKLMQYYPELRKEVIKGLLRDGEIMNIVGAPKSNKSWSSLNIGFSVISGGLFLGKFQCARGKVLIVDNELHEETISYRIKTVAAAMNVPLSRAGNLLDYWPLRGQLRDIDQLEEVFATIRPGEYKIVILDALYKFYKDGFDENSNSDFGQLYNKLDYYARGLDAAMVIIHHSAKGGTFGKSVTDVGAGAGTQTRACDSHLVFREHEEKGVFICDAANRSFAPIVPFCVEFKYPVWKLNTTADPANVKGSSEQNAPRGKKCKDGMPYAKDMISNGIPRAADDPREKQIMDIMSKVNRPMTMREITEIGLGTMTEWNREMCYREVRRLAQLGIMKTVVNSGGPKGGKYIFVAENERVKPKNGEEGIEWSSDTKQQKSLESDSKTEDLQDLSDQHQDSVGDYGPDTLNLEPNENDE